MSRSRRGFLPVALLPFVLACVANAWSLPASARVQEAGDQGDALADDGADDGKRQRRQRANDGDWFRMPAAYGDGGIQDFPSAQVHDAVVANTRAATARAEYRRAETSLHAAVRGAVRDFEKSKELREARAAEDKAYAAYQSARRDALRDVSSDPQYRAMMDLREGLTDRIAGRHERYEELVREVTSDPSVRLLSTPSKPVPLPPVAGNELVAMATLKMRIGTEAREMERAALENNENVRKAREEFEAAGAKVASLRGSFDEMLRDNEDLKKAREALEDARIARVAAETYFKGANLAAGKALDYAWWLRRYDYYRYSRYPDYYYPYSYRLGVPYYGARLVGVRPGMR